MVKKAEKKNKIILVLGSGGARGLAHIGVIKVLKEANIQIDEIVGVSMGAAIGAYCALGLDIDELEKRVIDLNKRITIARLLDFNNPKISVIKGNRINKLINEFLEEKTFKDLKIPLKILATDLSNGDEVIISRGSLATAVQASIAVPGIFPPVKIGSKYLVDGGVVNPTPLDIGLKSDPSLVIGVDLTIKRKINIINPSMVTTLMQSYEIIRTQAVMRHTLVSDRVVLIMPEMRGTIDSFKFNNVAKFIAAGEKAAREMLPEIKIRLKT